MFGRCWTSLRLRWTPSRPSHRFALLDSVCAVLVACAIRWFNVIDRLRPRASGGLSITVVSSSLLPLKSLCHRSLSHINQPPSRWSAFVTVRVVVGCFAAIVVVVYRPVRPAYGSMSVQQIISAVLDRYATDYEPVYIIGDFTVRL